MLEHFFVKPQTVDRIMGCWLGAQIDQYVTALCEQDYAARSIYRRVPILTAFADFTAARNVDRTDHAEALVEAFAADWLSARRADRSADACRRNRNFVEGVVRHFFSQVVSKSVSTKCRQPGRPLSLPECRDSSTTFVKNAACVRVLFCTISTICAGSSDISGILDARLPRSRCRW